jgi:predicted CoA-binding protein
MNPSNDITLIVGASENPDRYSYMAALRLLAKGYKIKCYANRAGNVEGHPIQTSLPAANSIHTITMYVGPKNQTDLINELIQLNPKRIIFNPGTENLAFEQEAKKKGIEVIEACTLVMLSTGNY